MVPPGLVRSAVCGKLFESTELRGVGEPQPAPLCRNVHLSSTAQVIPPLLLCSIGRLPQTALIAGQTPRKTECFQDMFEHPFYSKFWNLKVAGEPVRAGSV